MFSDPVDLSNELYYEAMSFSSHRNPHRFFQSDVLRLYFTALEPCIGQSVSLLSCSSHFIHMQIWKLKLYQPLPHPILQQPPCCESFPPCLHISIPPTSLDKSFFFNSLSVRLPYSSILSVLAVFYLKFGFCCCPSFGCARRHSVSTYASILARSPLFSFF